LNEAEIERMKTLPPSLDLDEPLTEEELVQEAAPSKMKRRKAEGK